MQFSICFLAVLFFISFSEGRTTEHPWIKLSPAPLSEKVDIVVALKQRNVDQFLEKLEILGDPKSSEYSNWMTPQEVLDLVAPAQEKVASVISFLNTCKDTPSIINYRDALNVKASIECINSLFNVEFYTWSHKAGHKVYRHDSADYQFTIPSEIAGDVELITGIDNFPLVEARAKVQKTKVSDLKAKDFEYLVPQNAHDIYNIPNGLKITNSKTLQALIEFTGVGGPLFTDLAQMAKENNLPFTNISRVIGPYYAGESDGESTLDVEYMTNIAVAGDTSYITIDNGWAYEMALTLFNLDNPPLVNSVSCKFIDTESRKTTQAFRVEINPEGWMESLTCGSVTGAKCNGGTLAQYISRADTEIAKAGSIGITFIVASQDEGAPSDENSFCGMDSTHPLWPIYPATSQYVLAVGGTTVISSKNSKRAAPNVPICTSNYPCSSGTEETACMANNTFYTWTSGGGFSNYVKRPNYQKKAVEAYLNSGAIIPPNKWFNSTYRAYPDVAAMGDRILIIQNGQTSVTAGTSAATPVVAAIVSLLNDHRLNTGKKPLGYINKLWYTMAEEHPQAFNDKTWGNNKWSRASHACEYGYGATKGYDAVFGLGTPNFGEMVKYIDSLP